ARHQILLGDDLGKSLCAIESGVDEYGLVMALGTHGVAVDFEKFGTGRKYIHAQSLSRAWSLVMLGYRQAGNRVICRYRVPQVRPMETR
ncbi:MAG: hypothetical protein L0K67_02075, partial [Brevibacterium sp.]|nr:hypothetical protein [Brevibacterium sp.]